MGLSHPAKERQREAPVAGHDRDRRTRANFHAGVSAGSRRASVATFVCVEFLGIRCFVPMDASAFSRPHGTKSSEP
jgi:hypothetical protein